MTAPRPVTGLLSSVTTHLRDIVQAANLPGNLDGLLAHYILADTRCGIDWTVDPLAQAWLDANKSRLADTSGLAALGYGLAASRGTWPDHLHRPVQEGLDTLERRSPFQVDGVTFVNSAKLLVGIALAANLAPEDRARHRRWLAGVLQDPKLGPATPLLAYCRQHALRVVTDDLPPADPAPAEDNPVALAGWHWRHTTLGCQPEPEALRAAGERLLNNSLLDLPDHITPPEAALLLRGIERVVTTDMHALAQSRDNVAAMLGEFESAMRHWRHDGDHLQKPIRWEIASEREVQNILWLMLRPVYRDLVDEETLKKVGHSTYRADFGIPSLGLLIEAKYARAAADFKEFEQQLAVDHTYYFIDNPPYHEMIIFIYDESTSVQEYDQTRAALMRLHHVADVVIVSRPSHLPVPDRTKRKRAK